MLLTTNLLQIVKPSLNKSRGLPRIADPAKTKLCRLPRIALMRQGNGEDECVNPVLLFTSMRSSASLHVIWAQLEEEEEEGTFWGKKAFPAI